MARIVDGESTLKNLSYDILRMINDNNEPKVVLHSIKSRVNYLENVPKYMRVRWWNEKPDKREGVNTKIFNDEVDDEYMDWLKSIDSNS